MFTYYSTPSCVHIICIPPHAILKSRISLMALSRVTALSSVVNKQSVCPTIITFAKSIAATTTTTTASSAVVKIGVIGLVLLLILIIILILMFVGILEHVRMCRDCVLLFILLVLLGIIHFLNKLSHFVYLCSQMVIFYCVICLF